MPSLPEFFTTQNTQNYITYFKFTEQDIENACKELNPDCTPGPVGIPAELLRTAKADLAAPYNVTGLPGPCAHPTKATAGAGQPPPQELPASGAHYPHNQGVQKGGKKGPCL